MEAMHLECPVQCLGGRCSTNSVISDEEFDEGGDGVGLGQDTRPHGPPAVARDSKLLVPALPAPGGPLTQNEGGTQAPSGTTQAWRSPARKEPALVPPLPHGAPFQNSAGLLNETICLAFLTRLGLVRPSISPVRILVYLSPLPGPATRPGSEGGHGRFGLWLSCLFFSSGHSWSPC